MQFDVPTVEIGQATVPQGPAMCSGSEAGSYVRLIDFVYHSTLGLRVIKKMRFDVPSVEIGQATVPQGPLFFFFTLVQGPRRSLSLKLSDTRVYESRYDVPTVGIGAVTVPQQGPALNPPPSVGPA